DRRRLSPEKLPLQAALGRAGALVRRRFRLHGGPGAPGRRRLGQRVGRWRRPGRPSAAHAREPTRRRARRPPRPPGRAGHRRPRPGRPGRRPDLRPRPARHIRPGLSPRRGADGLQPDRPRRLPERRRRRRPDQGQRPHKRHVQLLRDGGPRARRRAGGLRRHRDGLPARRPDVPGVGRASLDDPAPRPRTRRRRRGFSPGAAGRVRLPCRRARAARDRGRGLPRHPHGQRHHPGRGLPRQGDLRRRGHRLRSAREPVGRGHDPGLRPDRGARRQDEADAALLPEHLRHRRSVRRGGPRPDLRPGPRGHRGRRRRQRRGQRRDRHRPARTGARRLPRARVRHEVHDLQRRGSPRVPAGRPARGRHGPPSHVPPRRRGDGGRRTPCRTARRGSTRKQEVRTRELQM
ncbi:MAG: hypothetical protein AVDCRST_MAG03-2398, partial [uncultured Rubrobacteraceae bacterium]